MRTNDSAIGAVHGHRARTDRRRLLRLAVDVGHEVDVRRQVDGHAAQGVDDLHEADQVDEHVVVDRDAEQLGQAALDRLRRVEPQLGVDWRRRCRGRWPGRRTRAGSGPAAAREASGGASRLRGTETLARSPVWRSMLTTIMVSVRRPQRFGPASPPSRAMFQRPGGERRGGGHRGRDGRRAGRWSARPWSSTRGATVHGDRGSGAATRGRDARGPPAGWAGRPGPSPAPANTVSSSVSWRTVTSAKTVPGRSAATADARPRGASRRRGRRARTRAGHEARAASAAAA